MKRPVGNQGISKAIALIVGVVVIALITGCEEQNPSGTRKARLVAAENIQLKKGLEQRDKQIERQKELLAKRQQEADAENIQLKKELEQLDKQIDKQKELVSKYQQEAAKNIQLKKELERRDKQIEKQKELIAKCQQEKKGLQERVQKNIKTLMDDVFSHVIEENKKLKAQIDQLKKAN